MLDIYLTLSQYVRITVVMLKSASQIKPFVQDCSKTFSVVFTILNRLPTERFSNDGLNLSPS